MNFLFVLVTLMPLFVGEKEKLATACDIQVGADLYPRLRPENLEELPKQFRTMNQDYQPEKNCKVSRVGLEKIHASASGQFSAKNLQFLAKKLPLKRIIVLDLRRENHGFINGSAVSWKLIQPIGGQSYEYNQGLSQNAIEEKEKDLLKLLKKNHIQEFKTDDGKVEFPIASLQTERELVEKEGFEYRRIPLLDHQHPTSEETDQLVALFKNLPKDAWLHVHCAAGEGRTTTVMAMWDMMSNPALSAQEIMERQHAIGGINLLEPKKHYAKHPEKIPSAEKRLAFLNLFHRYCRENPKLSWSEWVISFNKK